GFTFTDKASDGVRSDKNFDGDGTATAGCGWKKRLAKNALDYTGKLNADLFLLMGRENVNDAINGLGNVHGMEGAEYKVTAFCRGDGDADGFEVAHFADHDHVGVLPEGVF